MSAANDLQAFLERGSATGAQQAMSLTRRLFGDWHRPTRLGFVYAVCHNPYEKAGQPVALRLVEKPADSGDLALKQILKLLSGM